MLQNVILLLFVLLNHKSVFPLSKESIQSFQVPPGNCIISPAKKSMPGAKHVLTVVVETRWITLRHLAVQRRKAAFGSCQKKLYLMTKLSSILWKFSGVWTSRPGKDEAMGVCNHAISYHTTRYYYFPQTVFQVMSAATVTEGDIFSL